jgi:hypothetical protein
MDMEKQGDGAASAQEGDLADVVARANIAMASSSTSHHQPRPFPSASAHMMVPYEEERRQQPMSVASGVGVGNAAAMSAVVVDPYLLAATGYCLPQHQHQQLLGFQISEHAFCAAGVGGDVDAREDAMRISPPPAPPPHEMINRLLTLNFP